MSKNILNQNLNKKRLRTKEKEGKLNRLIDNNDLVNFNFEFDSNLGI